MRDNNAVDVAVINSQSCGAGGAGVGGDRKRRSDFIEGLQAARAAGLFEELHSAVGQPSHLELEPRSVLTENVYHLLTEDLAVSGPDVDHGLHLIQDKGLDLCHQVNVCLGLPWGTLYPRWLVAPPPMLSNADLLRAVRTVKDQDGLLIVSTDSPFLKRTRTHRQAQVGDAAASFAVPSGLAVGVGDGWGCADSCGVFQKLSLSHPRSLRRQRLRRGASGIWCVSDAVCVGNSKIYQSPFSVSSTVADSEVKRTEERMG